MARLGSFPQIRKEILNAKQQHCKDLYRFRLIYMQITQLCNAKVITLEEATRIKDIASSRDKENLVVAESIVEQLIANYNEKHDSDT